MALGTIVNLFVLRLTGDISSTDAESPLDRLISCRSWSGRLLICTNICSLSESGINIVWRGVVVDDTLADGKTLPCKTPWQIFLSHARPLMMSFLTFQPLPNIHIHTRSHVCALCMIWRMHFLCMAMSEW